MTDGILLAEIQRDRMLRRYDTLIIDEAHERSLNIDFILGYLKQLLPQTPRPQGDRHVAPRSTPNASPSTSPSADDPTAHAPAPIVEVTGPHVPGRDALSAVGADNPDASAEMPSARPGAGGASTRSTSCAEAAPATCSCSCPASARSTTPPMRSRRSTSANTEVLPLYARLSSAEQHRIFEPPFGPGAIVLSTNVAETSLTVPGVRYVVDAGTARISRYSQRLKVQRLPIEPVSQASANQRAGRCGRVAPGICIRLYSEDDFDAATRVHRPRDPAHQPRIGHPADDGDRTRRRRPVPVRRATGLAR